MGPLLHLLTVGILTEMIISVCCGFNFGYSDPRLMLGNVANIGLAQEYDTEPLLLNCFTRQVDPQGKVTSQMTVNIIPKRDPTGLGFDDRKGSQLSAQIQLSGSFTDTGKVYIFVTDRASSRGGCSNDAFGKIFLSDKNNPGKYFEFGMNPYGSNSGYTKMFHGWGKEYNPTFGYGSYPTPYNHGLGFGYTGYANNFGIGGFRMGFGSGLGLAGNAMFADRGEESGPGAIAILSMAPGVLTSGIVDNVGFENLGELAGRGVMACSGVTYDMEWNTICREPIYSCCSLKYDNTELSLVD